MHETKIRNDGDGDDDVTPLLVDQNEMYAFQLMYKSLIKNEKLLSSLDYDEKENHSSYGKYVIDNDGCGNLTSSLDWKTDLDELERMRMEVKRVRLERDDALKDARLEFEQAIALLRQQQITNKDINESQGIESIEGIEGIEGIESIESIQQEQQQQIAALEQELTMKELKITEVTENWTINHTNWEDAWNKQSIEIETTTLVHRKEIETLETNNQKYINELSEQHNQFITQAIQKAVEETETKAAALAVEKEQEVLAQEIHQSSASTSSSTPSSSSLNVIRENEEKLKIEKELLELKKEKLQLMNEATLKQQQHLIDLATLEEKNSIKMKLMEKKVLNKERLHQQQQQHQQQQMELEAKK